MARSARFATFPWVCTVDWSFQRELQSLRLWEWKGGGFCGVPSNWSVERAWWEEDESFTELGYNSGQVGRVASYSIYTSSRRCIFCVCCKVGFFICSSILGCHLLFSPSLLVFGMPSATEVIRSWVHRFQRFMYNPGSVVWVTVVDGRSRPPF